MFLELKLQECGFPSILLYEIPADNADKLQLQPYQEGEFFKKYADAKACLSQVAELH